MSDHVVTAAPVKAPAIGRALGARLPSWTSIVFGAALMLLVLGALGRPAVFADTASYMLSGKDFWKVIPAPLHASAPARRVPAAVAQAEAAKERLGITMLSSRRPWYGVFAWPLERLGTLWLLAAVQSALAAWLIWLAWRILAPNAPPWTAFAVQGVTAGASTLPFIAGLAMPDLFASLMIVAVTLLLLAGNRLHRNERTSLVVITCFAAMVHGGNLMVAAAMIGLAAMMAFRPAAGRAGLWRPIYTVVLALALGMAANALFDLKITLIHKQAPGRPNFLAARLLADGPGRAYLRKACESGEPYLLCRHKAEPLNDSQAILWSSDEAQGVFSVSTPEERMALQREERRFVIGTILNDPVGVVAAAARNWLKQLGMAYAEAPLVDQRMYLGRAENYPAEPPRSAELYLPTWSTEVYRESLLPEIIKRLGDCTAAEPVCQPRLTIADAIPLQSAEFLAACMALAYVVVRAARRPWSDKLWLQALGLIAFAVVFNAGVCGALSGPFARYQSSVAWLATMMAAVGACSLVGGHKRPSQS